MVKIQENPTTKALSIQIPKALATAKGLKKGNCIEFILNDSGDMVLSIRK
jgi:hypothetical protein